MITRRQVVVGASAALAVGAAAGSQLLPDAPDAEAAASVTRGQRFRHRGRDVELVPMAGGAVHALVTRASRRAQVHVMRSELGGYHTHLLPFTEYRSAREAAESVIDAEDSALVIL